MQATAKSLRFHSKELLETVQRGEEVIITYRGKPCAKLVPLDQNDFEPGKSENLFGIWKDNEEIDDPSSHVRKIREPRHG